MNEELQGILAENLNRFVTVYKKTNMKARKVGMDKQLGKVASKNRLKQLYNRRENSKTRTQNGKQM